MMNPQRLEGELYAACDPDSGFIPSLREKYENLKTAMKAHRKVLLPHYKRRMGAARDRFVREYPLTAFFASASSVMTPLAAVLDPRPVTFAFSLGMVGYGYVMDKLAGAPHPYKPDK